MKLLNINLDWVIVLAARLPPHAQITQCSMTRRRQNERKLFLTPKNDKWDKNTNLLINFIMFSFREISKSRLRRQISVFHYQMWAWVAALCVQKSFHSNTAEKLAVKPVILLLFLLPQTMASMVLQHHPKTENHSLQLPIPDPAEIDEWVNNGNAFNWLNFKSACHSIDPARTMGCKEAKRWINESNNVNNRNREQKVRPESEPEPERHAEPGRGVSKEVYIVIILLKIIHIKWIYLLL